MKVTPSKGKGIKWPWSCFFCEGSGLAFNENRAMRRRSRVRGQGFYEAPCNTCGGTGKIRKIEGAKRIVSWLWKRCRIIVRGWFTKWR